MINLFKKKNTVKNSINEEYDIPQDLDLLNKWTTPHINPKVIYQIGSFDSFLKTKQVVKTTEESVSISNEEMIIKLLNLSDLVRYKQDYNFIHIGLVQVAFKPLTLQGLPESFIAVLRDARNLNWKQSLMGIIETSLAHGPVYFDVYPDLHLSLSDHNVDDALTLYVKTHGYNYAPGSEIICICYRIYFRLLTTMNARCKRINKQNNETILIETNYGKSNISIRRPVKWEEITFPETWVIDKAIKKQPQIKHRLSKLIETPEGNIEVEFEENDSNDSISQRFIKSKSAKSYISPLDYKVEFPEPTRASTSQMKVNRVENLNINNDNLVSGVHHQVREDDTVSQMSFNL
ncbi:putative viral movement protein [Helianthus annuus]|nr:putative viral movement protein [Helianthus annuus]KAJ0826135.1 putative viral movement protein [Helianthus annuus]